MKNKREVINVEYYTLSKQKDYKHYQIIIQLVWIPKLEEVKFVETAGLLM